MSALGHERTFCDGVMSALPPIADIDEQFFDVR